MDKPTEPYTVDRLLREADAADERYKALAAQFPAGTLNEDRNRTRELRDRLRACAKHLQSRGVTSALHVGPFSAVKFCRGQRVRISAGAVIWGTGPSMPVGGKTLTRSQVVTIHSVDAGWVGDPLRQEVRDPQACWVGAGGYWRYAALNDIEEL